MEKTVKSGNPFFMQVSFYANHLKYQARPETIKKYEGLKDKETKYQNSALWAAMNEDMDTAVGQILDKIEALGIKKNTYVIYTADNGYEFKKDMNKVVDERSYHKAYPLKSHKYTISEGGLRVPFIVCGPGIPPGKTSREPVVGWDIMPTVLEMAGAQDQIPAEVEGGSILPLCKSGDIEKVQRKDPYLIFRYTKVHAALDISIVQGGFKFLRDIRTGNEYLWNLWEDLGEEKNLVSIMPEKSSELRKRMDAYFSRLNWNEKEHVNEKRKVSKKKKPIKKGQ